MYKLISLNNTQPRIAKKYKGLVPEDFAYGSGDTFAVCDGVTLLHQHPYPNPSPAAFAARLAAKSIVKSLSSNSFKGVQSLKQAFIRANSAIKKYNRSIGLSPQTVDFLDKQYAATVSSFGRISDGKLYWGQINDCGVMIVDATGKIIINKILDRKPIYAYIEEMKRVNKFQTGGPAEHQNFRSKVVNNTRLKYGGKQIRWGVMTGEVQAIKFLQTGSIRLQPGWSVIFYSDGLMPLLALHSFRKLIVSDATKKKIIEFMKKKEKMGKKFKSERTMIVVTI